MMTVTRRGKLIIVCSECRREKPYKKGERWYHRAVPDHTGWKGDFCPRCFLALWHRSRLQGYRPVVYRGDIG